MKKGKKQHYFCTQLQNSGGEGCHILRVVTLPNSKDILTMFPLNQINYNLEDDSLDFAKGPILQRKKV